MFESGVDQSGMAGRVGSTCPARTEAGGILPSTVSFETSQLLERGGRLGLARRWPRNRGIPQVLRHDGAQAGPSSVFATYAGARQA